MGVVLKQGKKTIAEQIVYTALDELNKKVEGRELRSKVRSLPRKHQSRASRRSPAASVVRTIRFLEVAPERAKALALRWLLDAARDRSEANMALRLAAELVAAKNNEGNAVRKTGCP